MNILGIGGSLREGSATILALKVALEGAEAVGAHTNMIDLATYKLPMYNGTYSLDGYTRQESDSIMALLDAVEAAQGIILASPTYHNTISGSLKNALDFLELFIEDRPARFEDKVVGLVTVQGGTSGTGNNALTTMLLAARSLHAWVSPTMVSVPGGREAFTDEGLPNNERIDNRLRGLGADVAQASLVWSKRDSLINT